MPAQTTRFFAENSNRIIFNLVYVHLSVEDKQNPLTADRMETLKYLKKNSSPFVEFLGSGYDGQVKKIKDVDFSGWQAQIHTRLGFW